MSEQSITREYVEKWARGELGFDESGNLPFANRIEQDVAKALLAADDALKSGCVGCRGGWSMPGQTNALGEPLHLIPDNQGWVVCTLNEQARAARLPTKVEVKHESE